MRRHVVGLLIAGLLAIVADASAQVLKTGTLAAAGDTVVFSFATVASVTVQLSGSWEGAVAFEASVDGSQWWAIPALNHGDGAPVGPAATNGLIVINNAGYGLGRARALGVSSGTITVITTRGFLATPTALVLKTIGPTGAVLPAQAATTLAPRLPLPACNAITKISGNCRS